MTTNGFDTWEQRRSRFSQITDSSFPHNKGVIFSELQNASITELAFSFDGEDDEGQIHLSQIAAGRKPASLPTSVVSIFEPKQDGSGYDILTLEFAEAIETFLYTLLEHACQGWETGEGSHGEFIFDVANQLVTLEYSERFVKHTHRQW